MAIFGMSFSFVLGTVCGVYIAQNYNVPNIRKLANDYFLKAKQVEETYRRPSNNTKDRSSNN